MRPYRPKFDRPHKPETAFVQPAAGDQRPDPKAGRWASIGQAAEAVGWSRSVLIEAVERDPSLLAWAGPVPLVDLDRLDRAIGRGA